MIDKQLDWYATGMGHNGACMQWELNTMGLVCNGNDTQLEWDIQGRWSYIRVLRLQILARPENLTSSPCDCFAAVGSQSPLSIR